MKHAWQTTFRGKANRAPLSRRHVLKGAGVALALPWMESLAPRVARAQATAPQRFIPIYMPGGSSDYWAEVTGAGTTWELPALLQPFASLKSKMLLVKNLGNYTWRRDLLGLSDPAWYEYISRDDLGTQMPKAAYILPSHSRQASAYMCCTDGDAVRRDLGLEANTDSTNSISADQVIAEALAAQSVTSVASLELGMLNGDGELDGRNSAMSRNMSWNSQGTPRPKDMDPLSVFNRLIAGGAGGSGMPVDPADAEAAAKRRALDLSALDAMGQSVDQLKPRLGMGDNTRLDQFLTGVRELEQRIETSQNQVGGAACTPIAMPGSGQLPLGEAPADPVAHGAIMNDLIVMALQCDVTRVVSYMLDNSRSDLQYTWVQQRDFSNGGAPMGGTAGSYHSSQHGGLHNATFASITHWMVERVADLATKMDAVQEGERTLLDNSLILFSSDMHHGDHAAWDLPLALIGSGGGVFRQNEHVVLEEDPAEARQMRDLLFTIMNSYFELGVANFGEDARGEANRLITEILA